VDQEDELQIPSMLMHSKTREERTGCEHKVEIISTVPRLCWEWKCNSTVFF